MLARLCVVCVRCGASRRTSHKSKPMHTHAHAHARQVAGRALQANITRLGPKVLPLSEQLVFAGNFIARKARVHCLTLLCIAACALPHIALPHIACLSVVFACHSSRRKARCIATYCLFSHTLTHTHTAHTHTHAAQVLRMRSVPAYVPDFKLAFEHFCVHPGGKAVIGSVGKARARRACVAAAAPCFAWRLHRACASRACTRSAPLMNARPGPFHL